MMTLDASGCSMLQRLYCGLNQLVTLDVSGCNALKKLECSTNQLTALDLSLNKSLVWLNCDDNRLTVLDVSKNPALMQLLCECNQLTAINVSGCVVLRELYCMGNQLRGKAMDALISNLPIWDSATLLFYLKDAYNYYGIGPDGNVCTKEQVQAARAKGWNVYYSEDSKWFPYEGEDAEGLAGVESNDTDGPWYNLGGWKLGGSPKKGGVYIVNGKKVVVK